MHVFQKSLLSAAVDQAYAPYWDDNGEQDKNGAFAHWSLQKVDESNTQKANKIGHSGAMIQGKQWKQW